MSSPSEPVGTTAISAEIACSPSFMMEPLPNCFSIWLRARSSALLLISIAIACCLRGIYLLRCESCHKRTPIALSAAAGVHRGVDNATVVLRKEQMLTILLTPKPPRLARLEQKGCERFVEGAVGAEHGCDRASSIRFARRRTRGLCAALNASRVSDSMAAIADSADRQMPAPAALLALETVFGRDRLQPRGKRRRSSDAVQSNPNRARMLEVGERADARRRDLERRRPGRELMHPRGQPLQAMRIDGRAEELERDMQVGARDPADAVVRTPQFVDGLSRSTSSTCSFIRIATNARTPLASRCPRSSRRSVRA